MLKYLFPFLLCTPACMAPADIKENATQNARTYAQEMGISITGVSCSDNDSDLDRYVTCTLNLGDAGTRSIECCYAGGRSGCKEKQLPVVVGASKP